MIRWWTEETRVSSNVKDMVQHLTTPNTWKTCCSFLVRKPGKFLDLTPILFCILFCMFEVLFFDFL
jgi:hypothetical protein